MSFFGSLGFMGGAGLSFHEEDPFMNTRNLFGQMDRVMSSMMRDPFGEDPFMRGSAFPSLMAPPNAQQQQQQQQQQQIQRVDPFGFPNFGGSLMSSMESMAREGSCHSYSSSSVMTMTTGPDGRPQAPVMMQKTDANSCRWQERATRGMQVYQASSSSRAAPGGVRETRRSVADSSSGLRKMAIGHHIGDRSHVVEKEVDRRGELEERQEFVNLDEEEAPEFDREFQQKTHQAYGAIDHRPRLRQERPSASSPSRQRYLPALPSSSSRGEERARHREKGGGGKSRRHHY